MKNGKLIQFDSRKQLLARARLYVDSIETFFEEEQTAIPLLLRALKCADAELKCEIILLLGGFAKEQVVWPLYRMMTDDKEVDVVRHDAAIQLSVTLAHVRDPEPIVDCLLADLRCDDSELRANAAFALGWEGNTRAATALIERLFDADPMVQQSAVNALANLRDDYIFSLLLDRLEHGPTEQKRSILFNLWRFESKRDIVEAVYLKYLRHEQIELRYDALILLGSLAEPEDYVEVYLECLQDDAARLRALALERLKEVDKNLLRPWRAKIEPLLHDTDNYVKQAAVVVLNQL